MSTPTTTRVLRSPAWRLVLRVTWVAVELVLVLWLGQKGAYFVYQGF